MKDKKLLVCIWISSFFILLSCAHSEELHNEEIPKYFADEFGLTMIVEQTMAGPSSGILMAIEGQQDERQTEFVTYFKLVYLNQPRYTGFITGVVNKPGHEWEGKKVLIIYEDRKLPPKMAKAAIFELDERYDTMLQPRLPGMEAGQIVEYGDEYQQIDFGCAFPVKQLLATYNIEAGMTANPEEADQAWRERYAQPPGTAPDGWTAPPYITHTPTITIP